MAPADLTLEEQTADGDTALVLAAEAGSADNVRILLEHGASPHNTNSRNESPLLIGSKTQNSIGSNHYWILATGIRAEQRTETINWLPIATMSDCSCWEFCYFIFLLMEATIRLRDAVALMKLE